MNKILTLVTLLFGFYSFSQLPTLEWVKSLGGLAGDYGTSTIVDGNGNVYSTGFFTETVDFDPGPSVFNLTSNGYEDIYLLKLDPDGNFLWCNAFGSSNAPLGLGEKGNDLALDSQGNIVIIGNHHGICNFDLGATDFSLVSNGYSDIFIAKYSSSGNFIWAKGIGGTNIDYSTSVEIDINDNVYVTGAFFGTVDFDPGIGVFDLSPILPNSNGSYSVSEQIFQLKLNLNGDFLWANQTGDGGNDLAFSALDNLGNIFSTGRFGGTCDFNPGVGVSNLTSSLGYSSFFVRKMDTNGNFLWVHGFNSSITNSEGTSITADQNGNVIASGYFQGTVDFDPSANSFNLTSNGSTDCFILKLSSNGDFLWAKSFGSSNPAVEYFNSVISDNQNNIYAIGTSNDMINQIDMDPSNNSNYLVNNYGTFLIKLNQIGDLVWAICPEASTGSNNIQLCQTATGNGGGGIDGGTCLYVSDDAIYITSAFRSTIDFDPSLGSFNLMTSINISDIFVHKLNICNNSTNTINVSECAQYIAPSGTIHVTSGVFNDTIPNAVGCDSIITISLTINQSSSVSISSSICSNSYTAPDGQVYTASGNYIAVIPNLAGCDSTISINLTLLQIPTISAGVNQTVCNGTSVTLSGLGGAFYTWDNSVLDGVSFIPPLGINEYIVSGMLTNSCTNTDTVIVTVNELPVVSFSSNFTSGCAPLSVNLTNDYQYQTCTWTINGINYSECDMLTLILLDTGCYDVSLHLTTVQGCVNQSTINEFICIYETPNASFTSSVTTISDLGTSVSFTNNSVNASTYGWNFDDLNPFSSQINPIHFFETTQLTDTFYVELIAYSIYGCSDTVNQVIYFLPNNAVPIDVFIPTGFSPNDDNENDSWSITGLEKYPNSIINVFNRWGQLLFEGGPKNSIWNGLYEGKILPTADYYYIVDLGNGTKFNGVVTLKQ